MRLLLYIRHGRKGELELIHLSSKYTFTIISDNNGLSLCYRENENYIKGFYGEKVKDFSVIVGNNGAGKTSLIQTIAKKVEDLLGSQKESEREDSLIFECQDDWYVSNDLSDLSLNDTKCLNENSNKERTLKRYYHYGQRLDSKLASYFYSPTLEVHQDPNFSKVIDCSTTGILRSDKKGNHNENAYQRLVDSDMERQIDFSVNFDDEISSSINLPDNIGCKITILPTENIKFLTTFSSFEERIDNSIIFKNYNKLWENIKVKYLKILEKNYEENKDVDIYWKSQVETFFIRNLLAIYPIEKVIHEALELEAEEKDLEDLVSCYAALMMFYTKRLNGNKWEKNNDEENIFSQIIKLSFDEEIVKLFFYKIRKFEMYGISDMFSFYWEGLSSGENSLLNLFSRFLINKKNHKNILIFIDEIDLGFHPKWQQELVNLILTIFPKLFTGEIQIIMTTHSPLLLSNFRQQDVVLLTKNGNNDIVVKENDILTLGANMHKLLANNFFLENALMGAFAKKRINEFFNFVVDNKGVKPKEIDYVNQQRYLKSIISEIGEPILRKKAIEEYNNYLVIQGENAGRQSKLEKELDELRMEIERLKGKEV